MNQKKFLQELKKPETYKEKPENVKIIQTHISYVALTGDYAYKIKKPVDFGFLDFSSLEKRKHFCEQELKLNKRLCPEIYKKTVPITKKDDQIRIDGDGEIIDYAVKMKEFSQEKIISSLLHKGKLDEETIKKIVDNLVEFYSSEETNDEIKKYGKIETIKQNTDENFEQTENKINQTISENTFNFIKKTTNRFLEEKENVFNKRIKKGSILDCHGDLHTGNIVLTENRICIFDCIEFNKRFRFSDVASDIGFLAMDLDFQGFPYLSSYLIERYVEKSKDENIYDVLNFYKCYRAYVRGKVTGFQLDDPNVEEETKKELKKTANKYFRLANYYAHLMKNQIKTKKTTLFITSGLTGTGKTTFSRKISVDYKAKRLNTDEIRKEIFDIGKYEHHYEEYNKGLYSPENMEKVYDKIFEKTKNFLSDGKNVVIDATFRKQNLRDKAKETADEVGSNFVILNTVMPEDLVRKYLDERMEKKTVSDGRWEIYQKQKNSFEPYKHESVVEVDVSDQDFEYQLKKLSKIFDKIK